MKHLSIPLLIVSLSFIVFFSCGKANTADISSSDTSTNDVSKDKNNPTDKLTKEQVLERMHKANQDKSIIDSKTSEMIAKKQTQGGRIGADQAEQSSRQIREKYEKVKDAPPTKKQKLVADNICSCLNKNSLFKPALKAKSAKELLKVVGEDKDKEVKSLQDCYNSNMVPAVNSLGEEAGIFAMKSRVYLNNKCLDGTDKFWINIGAHLNRHASKNDINIDMNKMEQAGFKPASGK